MLNLLAKAKIIHIYIDFTIRSAIIEKLTPL